MLFLVSQDVYYKKINRKLEENLNIRNDRLDKAINEFNEQMKTTKNIPFNKNQVIVNVDTFDTVKKIVKESKKVVELQPKINQVFEEVDSYVQSFQELNKKNKNMEKEIKSLTTRNQNLKQENNNLKNYLKSILRAIKGFFKELLHIGNDRTKEVTTKEIKIYYDSDNFDKYDVVDIAKDTTKEDELFEYIGIKKYEEIDYDKNDLSL